MAKTLKTRKIEIRPRKATVGRYLKRSTGGEGPPRATITVSEATGKPKPLENAPHLRGDKSLSDLVTEER